MGGLQTRDAVHYQGTSELRPHSARTVKGVPERLLTTVRSIHTYVLRQLRGPSSAHTVHHAAAYHEARLLVV